ncbi:MAG: class I SAM-dependent methyltransferase [Kangiellaceae bacterium]|nr:class I SAM-dependent methyltransferase [Kangiellaceae bacterium]
MNLKIMAISALILAVTACSNDKAEEKAQAEKNANEESQVNEVTTEAQPKLQQSALELAIDGVHRTLEHKVRDKYRHPKETLEFFAVKPGMKVVEIWPGGSGWYTEILAPLVGKEGKLYAAQFDPNHEVDFYGKARTKFTEKMNANPEVYANVQITTFQPPKHLEIAPENSVDYVLTFRNVHNWMMNNGGRDNALIAFKAMYKALKPGGYLGVVEHSLASGLEQEEFAQSGYMNEKYTIDLAKEAGFVLVGKSDVNRNYKDTTQHLKGVWTLPPRLALGDEDKEKYLEIGESNRMTLRFVKPAAQ